MSAGRVGEGRPAVLVDTDNATQRMTLADGTELSPALGIGVFADKTLVAAGRAHQGRPGGPPRSRVCWVCGVMAGLGAALNTGAGRSR